MKKNIKLKSLFSSDRIGLIIAMVFIVAIFTSINSNYLSKANLINILVAATLVGLVAIGETLLIIAGCVDLSAGSVAAFASVLAAVLLSKGMGLMATLLVVIISGLIFGLGNALAVNKLKLEPFIATLATMSLVRGFAYIICEGQPVAIMNEAFLKMGSARVLGIPIPVIILILSFIIFGVILSKTRFGRSIYVIGGNKTAARLAGLDSEKIITILYMVTGALAALGGAILAARMCSGQPSASNGLEFDAVTAAVLGGTAFSGGVGTIFGTVLGVLILQGFNTGLIMINVPIFWQYVARGLLLLIALAFDYYRRKKREQQLINKSLTDSNTKSSESKSASI